jgi:hypothetical protein
MDFSVPEISYQGAIKTKGRLNGDSVIVIIGISSSLPFLVWTHQVNRVKIKR